MIIENRGIWMRWINVGGMKVRAALAVLYDVVGVDILGTKRWKANAGELQLVAQLGTVTESVHCSEGLFLLWFERRFGDQGRGEVGGGVVNEVEPLVYRIVRIRRASARAWGLKAREKEGGAGQGLRVDVHSPTKSTHPESPSRSAQLAASQLRGYGMLKC